MVTLAALCLAAGLDMHAAGETELERIWTKVDAIRAKQAAKPTGSALPQAWNSGITIEGADVVLRASGSGGAVQEMKFHSLSEAWAFAGSEDGKAWMASVVRPGA